LAYRVQVAFRNVNQRIAPQIFDLLKKGLDIILHPVVFDRVLENGLDRLLDELLQGVAVVVELLEPAA
jgi:hypothetical protein